MQTKERSDDLIFTRCATLRAIAKEAGIDPRTARRVAAETGALLKLGDAKNSRVLVIRDRFWDGLVKLYRITG